MLKRIRNVHPLFYMPLAFLAFPILGVFFLGYPVWTLGITAAFLLGYLFLVNFEEKSLNQFLLVTHAILYYLHDTLC